MKTILNYKFIFSLLLILGGTQYFLSDKIISEGTFRKNEIAPHENIYLNSASNLHRSQREVNTSSHRYVNFIGYNIQKKQALKGNKALIIIYFENKPDVTEVSKAPLKYNKEFAYSFTFDDGKADSYTAAYPLFSGGYSAETGQTYPGLFYTDGCGNDIPFRGGIAINSISSNGDDPHEGTPGVITWNQVSDLYSKKWDLFNHSYTHKNGPGTDYTAEILNNNTYVKSKIGITLSHFVIPSGDSEYTNYAFNNGMKAVYNQKDFPGGTGLKIESPLSLQNFKLYRQYLDDNIYNQNSGKVNAVAAKSSSTAHYWYSEFTHSVSKTPRGGSLVFPTFKSHMENIEKNYGKGGKDNVWMAPLQEVYEYLSVREYSSTSQSLQGNALYLYVDFDQVPDDLRRYAMTFLINSEENITQVECQTASGITFKGTGSNKMINIEWPKSPLFITGIFDQVPDTRITVYPNPAKKEIYMVLPDEGMKKVFVSFINETGAEYIIGNKEVHNQKVFIELNSLNLKKGLYIIKLKSEDGKLKFGKFILEE
ncbi:MAG: T9SS type A sorting domain-containing protein [Cytophagaceae bacterium]|nr:T9SS type A sorting domain-containing protein [Cytophagaceae bacterium]